VSRSTVENQDATWLYLRAPIATPLRVADPRSLPRGQIKTLPFAGPVSRVVIKAGELPNGSRGLLYSFCAPQSAGGPAHSRTLTRVMEQTSFPPGFGVRRPSGAFG